MLGEGEAGGLWGGRLTCEDLVGVDVRFASLARIVGVFLLCLGRRARSKSTRLNSSHVKRSRMPSSA